MQIGMIGLGRMGANMVRRLLEAGHQCVVFDMSPKAVQDLVQAKALGVHDAAFHKKAGLRVMDMVWTWSRATGSIASCATSEPA